MPRQEDYSLCNTLYMETETALHVKALQRLFHAPVK